MKHLKTVRKWKVKLKGDSYWDRILGTTYIVKLEISEDGTYSWSAKRDHYLVSYIDMPVAERTVEAIKSVQENLGPPSKIHG
jgi:hypothetical protein